MALYRCSVGGGGGGGDIGDSGSIETITANTEYTITATKLSAIDKILIHGYSTDTYGYALQMGILFDSTDAGYFHTFCHYGNGGNQVNQRLTIPANSQDYCFVVTEVTNNTIKFRTPRQSGRAKMHLEWIAV